jgi:hypothetical protein
LYEERGFAPLWFDDVLPGHFVVTGIGEHTTLLARKAAAQ